MFWLPEQTAANALSPTCTLTWTRREQEPSANQLSAITVDGAEERATDVERIENVLWRTRGQAHYLSYEEPSEADGAIASGEGNLRTTLRIEAAALTWIRHGVVTWTHRFREGEHHVSSMYLAAQSAVVETDTTALAIDVKSLAGNVHLDYEMKLGGALTRIETAIAFQRNPG